MLKESEVSSHCETAPCDSLSEYDFFPHEIWCLIVNNLYDQKRVRWFFLSVTVSRAWRELAYLSVTSLDPDYCRLIALGDDVKLSLTALAYTSSALDNLR